MLDTNFCHVFIKSYLRSISVVYMLDTIFSSINVKLFNISWCAQLQKKFLSPLWEMVAIVLYRCTSVNLILSLRNKQDEICDKCSDILFSIIVSKIFLCNCTHKILLPHLLFLTHLIFLKFLLRHDEIFLKVRIRLCHHVWFFDTLYRLYR